MPDKTPYYGLEKPLASEYYDVAVQNGNMDKLDAALHRLAQGRIMYGRIFGEITERDPSKPAYGLGGGTGEDAVALLTGPYTGQAEVAVVLDGKLYDAQNISTDGTAVPDGNIILQEE